MILIDAGPLVAIVRRDDRHSEACREALASLREPMMTVWPAFTEAMYLLSATDVGPDLLWEMAASPAVSMAELTAEDYPRMRELMRKYRDRPMDLADAALVHVAEREGIQRVFTLDRRDFQVYRARGRKFDIVP